MTKRGITINYNGKDCFVFIDNLTFPGITDFYVKDLNFIYHNGGKEMILMYYDSVYSFSFKTKFQSQSLIEILYNSNIIKHK